MADSSETRTRVVTPAQIVGMTERCHDDLSGTTTAVERLAMVHELSRRMWELSGRPLPSYTRSEMPVRIVDSA